MATHKDLTDYFAERTITDKEIERYGIVFTDAENAKNTLGLEYVPKTKSKLVPNVAALMPGHDGYYHCIFAAGGDGGFLGSSPLEYVKRTSSKKVAPNDVVLMRGHNWAFPPERVLIAESYVKGIVLARTGLPVIVFNGVAGYGRVPGIVPRLLELPWDGHGVRVMICYDSINKVNEDSARNVRHAKGVVAGIFHHHYRAESFDLALPPPTDDREDWGVDDFVRARGLDELVTLIGAAQLLDVDSRRAAVADYNTRFALITEMGRVGTLRAPFRFMTKEHFGLVYGNEHVVFTGRDRQGRPTTERQPIPKIWLADASRLTLDKIVFKPGEETILGTDLNIWEGFAVKPDYDGAEEAEEYFRDVILEAVPDGGAWLIKAFACLVQNPDLRTGWYLYLLGEKGTGKGYITGVMKAIFGGARSHAPSMTVENYANKFNSLKAAARMLFIDEVPVSMLREQKAALEAELKLDADPSVMTRPIERKGSDIVTVDRNCTVVISSNFMPPWEIEYGDRRAGCFKFLESMSVYDELRPWGTKDIDWWEDRFHWRDHRNGAAKTLAWLMNVDVSGFDPEVAPIITDIKRQIVGFNAGDFRGFMLQIRADISTLDFQGENVSKYRYMTTEQLARIYHQNEDNWVPDMGTLARYGKIIHALQFENSVVKVGPKGSQREFRVWRLYGPKEPSGAMVVKAYINPLNSILSRVGSKWRG